jgi:hypothetical protein
MDSALSCAALGWIGNATGTYEQLQFFEYLRASPPFVLFVHQQAPRDTTQTVVGHRGNIIRSAFLLRHEAEQAPIHLLYIFAWVGLLARRQLAHDDAQREHIGSTALLAPLLGVHFGCTVAWRSFATRKDRAVRIDSLLLQTLNNTADTQIGQLGTRIRAFAIEQNVGGLDVQMQDRLLTRMQVIERVADIDQDRHLLFDWQYRLGAIGSAIQKSVQRAMHELHHHGEVADDAHELHNVGVFCSTQKFDLVLEAVAARFKVCSVPHRWVFGCPDLLDCHRLVIPRGLQNLTKAPGSQNNSSVLDLAFGYQNGRAVHPRQIRERVLLDQLEAAKEQ